MAETTVHASSSTSTRKANRLIHEHSPYLLQHAYNPVDWYPWGEEAFKLARETNRPIFLSVGYSTCHWCHVMEKESFESDKIAEILNQHFVPIKVDREERPDVDRVYMSFVTAISGGGGWPMSVFLTPELTPFFGGTYFPPNDRFGRPGFATLLMRLHKAWSDPSKREEMKQQGSYVIEQLKENITSRSGGESDPDALITQVDKYIKTTYLSLYNEFDDKLGGFGGAPKFPRPVVFNFLFTAHRYYQNQGRATNDRKFKQLSESSQNMANFTLEKMSLGGIYDHLGGGFHRYSVDDYWHIPHFEKMLYDQGQLLSAYSVGYQLSTNERQREIFQRVVAETVEYLKRDMTHPNGGFYSAEDADSEPPSTEEKQHRSGDSHSHEKKEGAFYVWKASDLQNIFKKSGRFSDGDIKLFFLRYGIKDNGNIRPESDPHKELKGYNHLYIARSIETLATDISAEELTIKLEEMRMHLFEQRTHRPRPHLDDKVLTSWNSLVISGLVRAAAAFENDEFYQTAVRAMRFIQQHLCREKNGSRIPLHSFRGNSVADIEAFLDDYAFLIQAILDLYEYDGRTEWILWAKQLQDAQNALFLDNEDGGYFSVSGNDPSILLRLKSDEDSAEPAGNSISCLNLSRLYSLTHDEGYLKFAVGSVKSHALYLRRIPQAIPEMIRAMHSINATIPQIIVVSQNSNDNEEMLRAIRRVYLPFKTVIRLAINDEKNANSDTHYWLSSYPQIREYFQTIENKPTLYVCKNFSCQLPVTDTSRVEEALLHA